VAFLLSILFVQLALPAFDTLTGASISIPYGNIVFWTIMILYVFLTGLLAGSRPAFYLSSFNPVNVLKGSIQIGKAAALPRKILVVLQFTCSIALIISTVMSKTGRWVIAPRGLVSTDMSDDLGNHYDALKNDLLQSGVIECVAKASSPLTGVYWHTGIEKWPGQGAGDLGINVGGVSVSDNYFKTVGMKLIEGRDFSSNWSSDTSNIVVNESGR